MVVGESQRFSKRDGPNMAIYGVTVPFRSRVERCLDASVAGTEQTRVSSFPVRGGKKTLKSSTAELDFGGDTGLSDAPWPLSGFAKAVGCGPENAWTCLNRKLGSSAGY